MPHPEPERREHAPPGRSLLAELTPEQVLIRQLTRWV
jgi:hypothetical protein